MILEMFLILGQDAAVQAAPFPERSVTQGDLTVAQGSMMGWMGGTGLGGEVAATVVNAGTEPDRVVSVTSPAGPVDAILIDVVRDGQVVRSSDGDTSIPAARDGRASRSRVYGRLAGLAHGEASSVSTTITIRFERAGEVTVSAAPVSPAPSPG